MTITYSNGNLECSSYIMGKKCGVFAYLTASADTTVTSKDTYYPILGTFSNTVLQDFTTVADPAIKYTGTLTQYFMITWNATVSSTHNGCTVKIAIKKGGILVDSSVMGTLCKTAGELYNLSGITVVELATNDTIQLVLTADGDGDVVTNHYFTTALMEFFD